MTDKVSVISVEDEWMRDCVTQWRAEPMFAPTPNPVYLLTLQHGDPGIDRSGSHLKEFPSRIGRYTNKRLFIDSRAFKYLHDNVYSYEPSLAVGTEEVWHRVSSLHTIYCMFTGDSHYEQTRYTFEEFEDRMVGTSRLILNPVIDRQGTRCITRLASRVREDLFLHGLGTDEPFKWADARV